MKELRGLGLTTGEYVGNGQGEDEVRGVGPGPAGPASTGSIFLT